MRDFHSADIRQAEEPLVSVIINCYNSEKYLREAIDSVIAQTYSNWEIIFWDNASIDSTSSIIQSYHDARLKYYRGETLISLGHARNLAIEKSIGEFIAFLDSDDLWFPDKLKKQIPLFIVDNSVGLVYSDVLYFRNDNSSMQLYSYRKNYSGYCFREMLTDYFLCISSCIVRKEILSISNLWFDQNLFVCEDPDLFLRISINYKIDLVSEVLVKYRVHDQSSTYLNRELFFTEIDAIIKKLKTNPDVIKNHSKYLLIAQRANMVSRAKFVWEKGKSNDARRLIINNLGLNFRSFSFWVLTFLPYSFVLHFYSLFRKGKVGY